MTHRLPLPTAALDHRLGYPAGSAPHDLHGGPRHRAELLADAELAVLEAIDKHTAYTWHHTIPARAVALILDVAERELNNPTPLGPSLTLDERQRAYALRG